MDKAFVISAWMTDEAGPRPVVAVLFTQSNPAPVEITAMGFQKIESIDEVTITGVRPGTPQLYFFDRRPNATELSIARVGPGGVLLGKEKVDGAHPSYLIPEISGPAVDRLITPRGALGLWDFPDKRPSMPARQRLSVKSA